jgi:hypothetical protein
MDLDRNIKHKFNLKGLKIEDSFLGCNKCWFRHELHTGVKPICPECGNRMNLYYVTEKDMMGD